MIQNEYPELTLGELQKIIIDGIMQKFNVSEQPQYNDVPSLMFWLRRYKIDKPYESDKEYTRRIWRERNLLE